MHGSEVCQSIWSNVSQGECGRAAAEEAPTFNILCEWTARKRKQVIEKYPDELKKASIDDPDSD